MNKWCKREGGREKQTDMKEEQVKIKESERGSDEKKLTLKPKKHKNTIDDGKTLTEG